MEDDAPAAAGRNTAKATSAKKHRITSRAYSDAPFPPQSLHLTSAG